MIKKPKLNLRSLENLSIRLGGCKELEASLRYCLKYHEKCYKDHSRSCPEKQKFTRAIIDKKFLGLLKAIDQKLLKPYDSLLPKYLHGGLSAIDDNTGFKKSNITAAKSLVDGKRNRYLLKADLRRFFESITESAVISFFRSCGCSKDVSMALAHLCSVEQGPKGQKNTAEKVLARGFPTSPRLALWVKIEFFKKTENVIIKHVKSFSPLKASYIDDIGVTAVVPNALPLERLFTSMQVIAEKHGLTFNMDKYEILGPTDLKNIFGLNLHKSKVFPDNKFKRKHKNRIKEEKYGSVKGGQHYMRRVRTVSNINQAK